VIEAKEKRVKVTLNQITLLMHLSHHQVSIGELAALLRRSSAATTKNVQRLEQKRLVKRVVDEWDRRRILVSLTAPLCAFCSPGLVGAQASAPSRRCCDHPSPPKEPTFIPAPCCAGVEYPYRLSCFLECAGRSRCRPVVEDAAAFRSGDDHRHVLDERACQSSDQERDRSSSSKSLACACHQTINGKELSERACGIIAEFLGVAVHLRGPSETMEPDWKKGALKHASNGSDRAAPAP
jgi:MarR family